MIGLPRYGRPNRVMIAEGNDLGSNRLAFFMALASNQQNIARIQNIDARTNSFRPVANFLRTRTRGQNFRANDLGILAARIVVGDNNPVCMLCRNGPHLWPLALVAVTTTAKNHNQLSIRIRTKRDNGILKRIRRVRIVHKYRRTGLTLAHEIKPALCPLQGLQRMHHQHFFAARGEHKASRNQRIRSLEFTDQRQIDGMGFMRALQFQMLAEAISLRTQQLEFSAKFPNGKNFQAPRPGTRWLHPR